MGRRAGERGRKARDDLVVEENGRLDVVHLAAEGEDAQACLGLHAFDEYPAVERDEALLFG